MVADFAACPAQLRASVRPAVFKALALTPYVPRKPRLNEHGLPAASFGHQIRLLRLPNERYLWPSRGIALAAAGRSADLPYKDLLLRAPFIYRPNLMFALRQDWVKVCDTFASPEFPTIRTMAILWNGVKIIMKLRATRAESWGNQLILAACRQTTSFNDFSIEAGILLRGNGVPHAMPRLKHKIETQMKHGTVQNND